MIKKKTRILVFRYLAIIIMTLITLTPILWTFLSTIRPWGNVLGGTLFPTLQELTLDNYLKVFKEGDIFRYTWNSLLYSGGSALVCTIVSILAGYSLSRYNLPGKQIILTGFVFAMMIPILLLMIPIYFMLVKVNFLTRTALIIVYAAGNTPLCVWMIKTFMDSIPMQLDEAARIDGCKRIQVLTNVVLPLAKPVVVSAFIIVFVNGWNELMYALTILDRVDYHPITSGVLNSLGRYGNDWSRLNTMAMCACIPALILFMALQKYFIGGLVAGAVKE